MGFQNCCLFFNISASNNPRHEHPFSKYAFVLKTNEYKYVNINCINKLYILYSEAIQVRYINMFDGTHIRFLVVDKQPPSVVLRLVNRD